MPVQLHNEALQIFITFIHCHIWMEERTKNLKLKLIDFILKCHVNVESEARM